MNKGPDAYRTIGEASKEVGVEPYVLRFWETKFSQLRPVKRSGGRRFYRPSDINKLRIIKSLLYDNGLTIKSYDSYADHYANTLAIWKNEFNIRSTIIWKIKCKN